jgi:hypothetical protein
MALALQLFATPAMSDALAPQALDDAWWTGPLLAPNAGTLPQGHLLFEPYVYDVIGIGHFDQDGALKASRYQADYGSQSYINYGVTDIFTAGLIPRFGHQQLGEGQNSAAAVDLGDISLQGQLRLNNFDEASRIPTISVNIGETFPTGRYDRLDRLGDGLGSGTYSTAFALYGQSYFWMGNGRLLRTRLDLTYSVSTDVGVSGASVYGTTAGFHGHADPGDEFTADLAFEYSVTRQWVLALDLWYQRENSTTVAGNTGTYRSGDSQLFYVAPALEFNWSGRYGLIAGARIAAAGRNAEASVAPLAAINCFF